MEKHLLSKSTFIRGDQCLKSLYLNKKRRFLRDRMPKERLIVFQRGHKIGELAHDLFPGGINMSPGHPAAFRKAIINTEEKIKEGFPVIYEAAFQSNQVMIFLDILVQTATGWHAYEVKSSGGISDTYLMDAALQYHVIKGTGLDIQSISLVHVNKDYILEDELDPKGLFKIVDVTDEALSRQDYVAEQIIREKEALQLEHSPKIDVGPHCRQPYDCDFLGHCWKNVPKPPIKDPKQQLDTDAIKSQGSELNESTAFIKLLPMKPAVPMYKGTRPYQDIIYGYSIMDVQGKVVSSRIFDHQDNPEDTLIPALEKDIEGFSEIICFGQSYLLKNLIPDGFPVLDLRSLITKDSDFFHEMKDLSELARLKKVFALKTKSGLPEYLSDAVAEHNYLKDYSSEEVQQHLEEYLSKNTELFLAYHAFIMSC
jgi:hypothetical protein